MGIAELAGAYFPNYMISMSTSARCARNLSLLQLVIPLSAVSPVLHGSLTDQFGFSASLALGATTGLLGLWFVLRLPATPTSAARPAGAKGKQRELS
jgi:cyanate permease